MLPVLSYGSGRIPFRFHHFLVINVCNTGLCSVSKPQIPIFDFCMNYLTTNACAAKPSNVSATS